MPTLDEIIARANALPQTRDGAQRLADELEGTPLAQCVTPALERVGMRAAGTLAFAAIANGEQLPQSSLIDLLPEVTGPLAFAALLGAAEGDRVTLAAELLTRYPLNHMQAALAVLLAVKELDGAEPPPSLRRKLRMLLRETQHPVAGYLAACAAESVDDHWVKVLATRWTQTLEGIPAEEVEPLLRLFREPSLDALPEVETIPRTPQGTVRHQRKPTGRNDPCPCGSGKKYKKCCAGQVSEARPGASEPTLDPGHLSAAQIRLMPSTDVARLEPDRLPTRTLIEACRHLTYHRRFHAAERFMEEIATRKDLPGDEHPDGYRLDVVDELLEANEIEWAARQYARLSPDCPPEHRMELQFACARNEPDLLDRFESHARAGLDQGGWTQALDLAYCLLRHRPALGVLLARGCISGNHYLDEEVLLAHMEEARDELGVAPFEPWWDIFEKLAETDEHGSKDLDASEAKELRHQLRDLRAKANQAEQEADKLSRRLSELDRTRLELERERDALAERVDATRANEARRRADDLETEHRRLRNKLHEAQQLVAEGNRERRRLRALLSERHRDVDSRQRSAAAASAAPDATDGDAASDEDGDVVPAEERPRSILVPEFSATTRGKLTSLPREVARAALQLVGALAAGQRNAWSDVKRMRIANRVRSARVGLHYRLLFTAEADTLRLLDLTHRRNLDEAVARLA
jgi:hypothetical protein